MCVLLITRLLRGVGRWARKPVNHTSWVAVVTPTDRPKSVRNRCLIEFFYGVVCVVALPFWHFCWCRGFCHRTGSDLLLFVFSSSCASQWYVHRKTHFKIRVSTIELNQFSKKRNEMFSRLLCRLVMWRLIIFPCQCCTIDSLNFWLKWSLQSMASSICPFVVTKRIFLIISRG